MRSLLLTQLWKLISQKLKMIETTFQILNTDILKQFRGFTCTRKIDVQCAVQKQFYLFLYYLKVFMSNVEHGDHLDISLLLKQSRFEILPLKLQINKSVVVSIH